MIKRLSVLVCVALVCLVARRTEAATRTVCASGCTYTNLQAAIDAAVFGDTILLRAGETYAGHYVLRAKSGTGWIEIRSDAAASSLPAAGERLVPSDRPGGTTSRSLLPRLVGRGGAYKSLAIIRTEPGAHGYLFRFIEFDGAAHLGYETLIQLDAGSSTSPYDITFDRVYVHGDRYKGQKRGFTLNARRVSVLNSYVADIKSVNADSQAIASWNGAGPLTIENNYLEAAGENVLFGGADPSITNLVPSDIVIRGNHFYKPLSWRKAILPTPGGVNAGARTGGSLAAGTHYFRVVALMSTGTRVAVSAPSAQESATVGSGGAVALSWGRVAGAGSYRVYRGTSSGNQSVYLTTTGTSLVYTGSGEAGGSPAASGTKWVVKNTFEVKNGARMTIEGNIFENCWSAGQYGYAIVLTPRNGGRAPWTRVQDLTFTNNIVRHVAGVVNIAGFDDSDPTQRTERITFRNNLFEDVNHQTYGTNAKAMLVGSGAAEITFDKNTIIHANTSVLYAYGDMTMPGLVYTNNISQHHTYGIMGQGSSLGIPTLTEFFPGAVVRCNVLAGGPASRYPTPNAFPTVAEWNASFVDPAAGNYALRSGSVVALSGCGGVPPGADMNALNDAIGGGLSAAPGAPGKPTNVRIVR